jgi:hypothetical protein
VSDRPIRLILDRSAVVAYTRGSIHVGEVLAEINDEAGCAAIPLPCLVEAARAAADHSRLELLVDHEATLVLADDPSKWRDLAALRDVVDSHDGVSAALAAIDLDVDILTRTPRLYAGVAGGDLVIPFDD